MKPAAIPDPERPAVLMSQEEHAAIGRLADGVEKLGETQGELTGTVKLLAANQGRLENTLSLFIGETGKRFDDTNKRFESMSHERQFSYSKLATFLGMASILAGAVAAINNMTIRNTISESVSPALSIIATQNTVSINERHELKERVDLLERDAREAYGTRRVNSERIGELYYKAHGHYPDNTRP